MFSQMDTIIHDLNDLGGLMPSWQMLASIFVVIKMSFSTCMRSLPLLRLCVAINILPSRYIDEQVNRLNGTTLF